MAKVIGVLTSGRRRGYTAGLLEDLLAGAATVAGVETELVYLHGYKFKPCTSCFFCDRHEGEGCSLNDDFGRKKEGILYKKVQKANGLAIGDPVHMWGPSAMCHTFIERMYPFLFTDELNGLPFASVSCASNQGMHRLAWREIAKWAFTYGFRYVGGLPVHMAYYQDARTDARELGEELGRAAVLDEREGRRKFNDEERFVNYMDKPWSVLEPYLDNLTAGKFDFEGSTVELGFTKFPYKMENARELLGKTANSLQEVLSDYKSGNVEAATRKLAQTSAYWTYATFYEFCQYEKTSVLPEGYKKLPDEQKS